MVLLVGQRCRVGDMDGGAGDIRCLRLRRFRVGRVRLDAFAGGRGWVEAAGELAGLEVDGWG